MLLCILLILHHLCNFVILHFFASPGWLRQRFGKQRNDSDQVKPCSQTCSSGHSNTSSSVCSSSSSSSSIPAKPSASDQPLPSVLSSRFRSSRRYDVSCVTAMRTVNLAQSLACFLEAPSNGRAVACRSGTVPAGGACPLSCCRPCRTVTAGCYPHSKLVEG